MENKKTLTQDLAAVINSHSRENASNTPDFILADYLVACLIAFEAASNHRGAWYGDARQPAASAIEELAPEARKLPPPDPTTASELADIVMTGIFAHRYLVDPGSVSAAENALLTEGARERGDAKQALKELVVLADHFGWPMQLVTEARGQFVARRGSELAEAERRLKVEREKLDAADR